MTEGLPQVPSCLYSMPSSEYVTDHNGNTNPHIELEDGEKTRTILSLQHSYGVGDYRLTTYIFLELIFKMNKNIRFHLLQCNESQHHFSKSGHLLVELKVVSGKPK